MNDERRRAVLKTALVLGKLDRWGDGASEQEIQDLLDAGLLRAFPISGSRYLLTSMGVQAARKALFDSRKKH